MQLLEIRPDSNDCGLKGVKDQVGTSQRQNRWKEAALGVSISAKASSSSPLCASITTSLVPFSNLSFRGMKASQLGMISSAV